MAVFKTFNSQDIIISPLEVNKSFTFLSSLNPPTPIPPINFGTGFDDEVMSIALQSDEKIIISGWFTLYKGITLNPDYIIRLNSNGDIDNTFNIGTGFDNTGIAYYIITQTDDKILLGGNFTSYNGTTTNGIIRLNPDGSRDNTFNIGVGFESNTPQSAKEVLSIVIQPDGKILVGGWFNSYNGVSSNRIIRLNPDGSRDNTFNIGTGFNGGITSLRIQTDGKILAGGQYSSYNGLTANRIIRLNPDGSRDNTFNMGTGFNDYVFSIVTQADDKILVGGWFNSYNGAVANHIIRLNPDGSRDNTFNIGTGFNSIVSELLFTQTDNKILASGWFTSYNGITSNRIIRLNLDGSIDNTFNTGIGFSSDEGLNTAVTSLLIKPDSKILAGGFFTFYNEILANNIIQLNPDGTRNSI
jgi:uncharacterized delta-60 repeat protein